MNILNIETFLTIVETQSLSNASEKLFVSQSTISTRLNTLERELNTKLIKRQPGIKQVETTPKGEEFIPIAKRWMALGKDTTLWISKEPTLKLNIGSVDSLNIFMLPPLYKGIINSNPSLSINVSSHSSVQIFGLLESHEIDIGLVTRIIKSNSLLSKPIFSEQMVLVSSSISSNYGNLIHPQDLDIRKEIFLDWGPNFQIWHDYWWDPTEHINITVDTVGLITKFIEIPESWAIVPKTIAHAFEISQPIRISELLEPPDERIYYKLINRYPRPSSIKPLKIFEKHLSEYISKHPYLENINNDGEQSK